MLNKMTGCQIALVFTTSICVITAIPFATRKGVLSNVAFAQEEFRGEYNVPGTDKGIWFNSKASPSSVEMYIASSSGYPILKVVRSVPSYSNHDVTIMSINSTNFLIVKNQEAGSTYDDYIIPDDTAKGIIMAMMSNYPAEINRKRILNLVHKQGIEETRKAVLSALAMSDEGKLIVQTALALGYDHKIQGKAHPSVMKFYQMARQLAAIREKENAEISEYEYAHYHEENNNYNQEYSNNEQDRADGEQSPEVQCESNDAMCASEESCPYHDYDNDCFGLCGYACTCWKFVCGDCCLHEFCRSHDYCCSTDYWSWTCIMTPFTSSLSNMECEDTVEC